MGKLVTTRASSSKMPTTVRVSVSGRSRVINITNESDVVETLKDMVRAANRKPAYSINVDQFVCDLNQRASELLEGAEAGKVDQETVSSAGRVRTAVDRFLQVSGPRRDERRQTADSSDESEYYTD